MPGGIIEGRSDASQGTSPAATASAGCGLRVLVVDDLVDAADTLGKLLEIMGCQVRVAHDGLAALSVAATFQPHIVFLDIGLPQLSGYEVARRLRRESPADLLLVALTGYGRESDLMQAKEAGFDQHLLKPASLEQLQRLLEQRSSLNTKTGSNKPG